MPATQTEPKHLSRFTISEVGDGFRLHIEDESGHTLELVASDEQLDLIIEELDRVLGDDSDFDEDED